MLFPPLSHLEVVGNPVVEMFGDEPPLKPVLVVTIKVNINQQFGTIQDLLARRKETIMSIGEGIVNDIDFDLSIASTLLYSKRPDLKQQVTDFKSTAISDFKIGLRDSPPQSEWYNNDKNFECELEKMLVSKKVTFQKYFQKILDLEDSELIPVLGSILAECARRGKAEMCAALIENTPKAALAQLINWTDSAVP